MPNAQTTSLTGASNSELRILPTNCKVPPSTPVKPPVVKRALSWFSAVVDHCRLLTTCVMELPALLPPPPTRSVASAVRSAGVSGVPVLKRSPRMPPISASDRFDANAPRLIDVAVTVCVDGVPGGSVSVTDTGAAELKTGNVTLAVSGRIPSTFKT
ncbi:hypothetical protein G6F57_018864 [Rhizopus arrhizus]|nr:hypothetical protein G6F57_018864 [Rhizopus arrhizus]